MRNVAREIAEAIQNEWPLKILSLALALVLWGYVITTTNAPTQEQRTLAVEVVNTPGKLVTTSIQPREVEVTFQGRRRALAAADLSEVAVIADLADLGDEQIGEHTIPLQTGPLPSTISAVLSQPAARITLDQKGSTERAVEVELLGKQASGFQMGTPRVSPTRIAIEGANSALREVARVVAVVDVSGFNSTVQKKITPELRDERNVPIPGLQTRPPTVEVTVPITKLATKTVPIIPRLSDPPGGYQIGSVQTTPSTVTIAGDESTIEKIESINTAHIDISNLRGEGTFTPSLVFDADVKSTGVSGARVTVTTKRVALPPPPEQPEPEEGESGTDSSGSAPPALSPDTDTETPTDEAPPADDAEDAAGVDETG